MAKILDPTIPEELLWRDAVELVSELTKSSETAEALLLASHAEEVACVPGTRVLRHSESAVETAFTAA